MTVTAAIKFTQGLTTAAAGIAVIGAAATAVVCSNGSDANVITWQWELVGKPNASALSLGIFAFGTTPAPSFTPDVVGWYLVRLTVFDQAGRTATDERVFAIPETSGRHIPCSGADKRSANFASSVLGWDPYLQDWLKFVDAMASGGAAVVWGVTQVDTTPYAVTATDVGLSVDTTIARTINLPATPGIGRIVVIWDEDGTANTFPITVNGNGHNINGSASVSLNESRTSYVFIYNGDTGWSVIAKFPAGSAVTFAAVQAALAAATSAIDLNGQKVTGSADATTATGLTTKQQMEVADSAVLSSAQAYALALVNQLDIKLSCKAASSTNVTLAAPGATIGGVTMTSAGVDRFLAYGQTSQPTNGLYLWNGPATPATRTSDADTSAEVTQGILVPVAEGTDTHKLFELTTADPIVLGTTALVFEETPGPISFQNVNSAFMAGSTKEFDFDKISTTFTTATAGKVREIDMSRYPVPSGGTRTVTFEGSLQSSVAAATAQSKIYDATAGVYLTSSTVDNSAAVDKTQPTTFTATLTTGTIDGTIRTDVAHQYELHVFRVGGTDADLTSASARIVLRFT